MSFQGFLTDPSGVPLGLNAPIDAPVIFRIYRTAGGTSAADILWAEAQTVTVDRGYYSVLLGNGSATGLADDKFTNDLTGVFLGPDVSERYLGVTVVGYREITPRVQFMASPFAHGSQAATGVVDPEGKLLMSVSSAGLGINLTRPATATVEVGGTVRATAFEGNGSGLTNVASTLALVAGKLTGAQLAEDAVTSAKLANRTIPGSALAEGSVDSSRLAADAVKLILSQAGGVGAGGGVFSRSPTNEALVNLGFVRVASRVIGGDRWIVKASEVTPNVPEPRTYRFGSAEMRQQHSCWTGAKWIVWGGRNAAETGYLGNGGIFDPVLNTWTPMSTSGAPSPRDSFQVIWLGDRMWLYGGFGGQSFEDAFFYDPALDQWTQANTAGGPGRRDRFSAVWTGTEIIVFGGGNGATWLNTGARYNPVTDTWRSMAPNPQRPYGDHNFAWTGTEMIIAGGHNTADEGAGIRKAARYNPVLDNWTPMPDIPIVVASASSVWTGKEYIYGWGHGSANQTYARYDPVANAWSDPLQARGPFPSDGTGKVHHQCAWTGTEMLIVGGWDGGKNRFECARFNPSTGIWNRMPDVPITTTHMPFIWTGKELLIFGDHLNNQDRTVIGYQPPIETYQYVKQ